jgi:hypothetical protein
MFYKRERIHTSLDPPSSAGIGDLTREICCSMRCSQRDLFIPKRSVPLYAGGETPRDIAGAWGSPLYTVVEIPRHIAGI